MFKNIIKFNAQVWEFAVSSDEVAGANDMVRSAVMKDLPEGSDYQIVMHQLRIFRRQESIHRWILTAVLPPYPLLKDLEEE